MYSFLVPNYFKWLRESIAEILRKTESSRQDVDDRLNALEDSVAQIRRIVERMERLDHVHDRFDSIDNQLVRMQEDMKCFQGNWQAEVISKSEDVSNSLLYRRMSTIYKLLHVKDIDASVHGEICRVGNENDGGYVMLNDYASSNIAYSFGIFDDVSWDKCMAASGLDVYMYDHTIDALPEENPKFHWEKTGITGLYDANEIQLKTLPMLLEENNHSNEKNMILKMDVEGAEWEVLGNLSVDILSRFDQILLELHGLNNDDEYDVIVDGLEKLNETHQLVHIHANNYGNYRMMAGMVLPDVIECTYLSKEKYSFRESEKFFPEDIDNRNQRYWPDILLGRMN